MFIQIYSCFFVVFFFFVQFDFTCVFWNTFVKKQKQPKNKTIYLFHIYYIMYILLIYYKNGVRTRSGQCMGITEMIPFLPVSLKYLRFLIQVPHQLVARTPFAHPPFSSDLREAWLPPCR